jgi:gliding motility-associated lipoprotein GldH
MAHIASRTIIKIACCLISTSCFFGSCKQMDLFEKNTNIPKVEWNTNFKAEGVFDITDTISTYNIYVVIRHTDAYKYNNVWLNVGLQAPGDSMQVQKINLPLGSDAAGWDGIGMNDIWEVRKLISGRPKPFLKPGDYRFNISQIMRDNPLQHIMSVGLRVEKAN